MTNQPYTYYGETSRDGWAWGCGQCLSGTHGLHTSAEAKARATDHAGRYHGGNCAVQHQMP